MPIMEISIVPLGTKTTSVSEYVANSIKVLKKQKGNKNLNEELQILFLHGLLHLLGYDHISVAQKKIMEIKEKKYWKKIKGEK